MPVAGQFGYFEFALAGIPLLVGTVLVIVLLGRRLLPERTPATLPQDLGDTHRRAARSSTRCPRDRAGHAPGGA